MPGHITQITGLPGEPAVAVQNMPPSVGPREVPEQGVREREKGLRAAGQHSKQADTVARRGGTEKGEGTRRQPALQGG